MARRVQGEAKKVKASKQVPSTVMDMCEAQMKIEARKYVTLKASDSYEGLQNRINTQRGVLRGVALTYCMWYGSTPGQPKMEMVKELEQRHVREARQTMEEDNAA